MVLPALLVAAVAFAAEPSPARFADEPIVYGRGAGGITLQTAFEDASKILPEPLPQSPAPGVRVYSPGLIVAWSEGDPNIPEAIFAERGYRGALSLPAPFGRVGIGSSLGTHFAEDDLEGAGVARLLYRVLENAPAADCVAAGSCGARRTPDRATVVLRFPAMNMLLHSRDKTVYRIVIKRNPDLEANR
ncbi:MAG: hypothetical protein HY078_03040 [Elusimicrobia bacterium]|nr:hypothetical protein [Elusimicrobiota bacterium]